MMKHCFPLIGIAFILLISCKLNSTKEERGSQDFNEVDVMQQQRKPVTVVVDTLNIALDSDSLLNLRLEDTIDCGAIINTLFRRSLYEFPLVDSYKKEELTAVIENAKDSVLFIKVMFIDSVTDYRQTVDWLKLNCKSKNLETVTLNRPTVKAGSIKYDVRLLDILMRKCALNYN